MLTHGERVLWPEAGFTKAQMVDYYRAIAPVLLPHIAGRAMTLARFPMGVQERGWYQSNCHAPPEFIRTVRIGRARYCVIESAEGLLWAANSGGIELHPFLSSAGEPERALAMVFDLDPMPPAGLRECCEVALLVREKLAPLRAFVKTSGAKGMHLFVPVDATFDRTRAFARELAAALRSATITDEVDKSQRAGKVYIDWRQNEPMRSTIAPYSLRATALPGVSAPLAWDEVDRPRWFSADQMLQRVRKRGDLWAEALTLRQWI